MESDRTVSVIDNHLSSIDKIKTNIKTLLKMYSERIEFNKELAKKTN